MLYRRNTRRYRKTEAKGVAPGLRQKASSEDQGAQITKKAKIAPQEIKARIVLVAQLTDVQRCQGVHIAFMPLERHHTCSGSEILDFNHLITRSAHQP